MPLYTRALRKLLFQESKEIVMGEGGGHAYKCPLGFSDFPVN
jgi:hypothetical protein